MIPIEERSIFLWEDSSGKTDFTVILKDSVVFKSLDQLPPIQKRNFNHIWWVKIQFNSKLSEEATWWLNIPGDYVDIFK